MKHLFLALLLASVSLAESPETKPATPGQKKALIDTLFSRISTPEFEKAVAQARLAGVPKQVLLESRFLHLIDQRDDTGLAKLAPELAAFSGQFSLDRSQVFAVKEDWLSIVHYTQALAALENKDTAGFKKHITEAFWLNPRHGSIYAPPIERLRLRQAMAKVTLDPKLSLQPQQGGEPVTLSDVLKGKKAAVLHFWSPMSQESEVNMPDFILTSKECRANGIAVVSVLVGQSAEVKQDAEVIRKKHQRETQCLWIADTGKPDLARTLRVTDIPTMVVVSPSGKILFNGHPSDNAFWQSVRALAPGFKRPDKSDSGHHDH